ncbi:MAG: NosD domain-containing protein [Anaerolineae bacterium]
MSSASDSGPNTLRQCLTDAVDGDEILFDPSVFPPAAPQTIALASELPPILLVDNLTIDASDAGVILDGGALESDSPIGVMIAFAQGVTLRGLQIRNFDTGVSLWGATDCTVGGDRSVGAGPLGQGNLISANATAGVRLEGVEGGATSHNSVIGNFIGTDVSGSTADGNGYAGVAVTFGATHNVIGGAHSSGTCDGPCNLISGNVVGVQIQDASTRDNQVVGNFIGTDMAGNSANGNEAAAVVARLGASQNVIGGARSPGVCDGPCNLISGNVDVGIVVQDDGTTGNQVLGNFVGTNASGDAALPNNHGVAIAQGASGTRIGGAAPGEGNLVSGNTNIGLWMSWPGTTGNQVFGNVVGMDISGAAALPNYHGVLISQSTDNLIGGAAAGAGNLISGNEFSGVWLEYLAAPGNTIAGNRIGTDLSGTQAVPNYIGIAHIEASGNVIGGTEPGAGNLISGNVQEGIHLGSNSNSNVVLGNTIGVDVTGDVAIHNTIWGIFVGFGASDNIIGGRNPGAGNLISGNGMAGVHVQDADSVGNRILGNRIGTNQDGSGALPNDNGVVVILARETIIGGADATPPWVCDGPCNLVSGNAGTAVTIQGVSADAAQGTMSDRTHRLVQDGQSNQVLGNFIGTDLSGTSALPNAAGVDVCYSATGNLMGGSSSLGEGNLISGNRRLGVIVRHPLTADNQISGNRIGTTADGQSALPNGEYGVWIYQGAWGNTVGGEGDGYGNLISGQALDLGYYGVVIGAETEPEARDNEVIGNRIGTNGAGTTAIPNGGGVAVAWGATGTVIRNNEISGNSGNAILFQDAADNEVRDNDIGVAADGSSPLANGIAGISLSTAPNNMIGAGNTIAYNLVGVAIVYPESVGNTITQNSIYANTAEQIVFLEVPKPLAPAPVLTGWDGEAVSGAACAACQVELFANPSSQPAGRTYLGTTAASGDGSFSLTVTPGESYLTATATDAEGTTSALSDSLFIGTYTHVYLPLTVRSTD